MYVFILLPQLANVLYLNNEEKLIKFLFEKFNNGRNNIVSVSKNDLPTIGMEENDVIRTFYVLQEDGFINIKEKSIHDDFSRFWTVELKSTCLHRFDAKD